MGAHHNQQLGPPHHRIRPIPGVSLQAPNTLCTMSCLQKSPKAPHGQCHLTSLRNRSGGRDPVGAQEEGVLLHPVYGTKALGGLEGNPGPKSAKLPSGLPKFQKELPHILEGIHPGDFLVSIDLSEAYFHIPIWLAHRQFLRFSYAGHHLQYWTLPFGLPLAPCSFTKILAALIAHLRTVPARLQAYLDDILIRARSDLTLTLQVM